MSAMSNYDVDVNEWTKEQADALRRRAPNELDWDNLAEEIESLGSSNRRQIKSRLEILILHLLKWKYQPEWQCGSWRGSIPRGAPSLGRSARRSPSLRPLPADYLPKAYARARAKSARRDRPLPPPRDLPVDDRARFWTPIFCLELGLPQPASSRSRRRVVHRDPLPQRRPRRHGGHRGGGAKGVGGLGGIDLQAVQSANRPHDLQFESRCDNPQI